MKIQNKALADLEKDARREAEAEIVYKLLCEDHRPGDNVRPSLDGGMEVNLKYLKAQMPFFSERTIQLALYALQASGRLGFKQDKGFGSCIKWYKIR